MTIQTTAPDWFDQAINTPFSTHTVNIDNCPIVYQTWGKADNPPLFLLHGNGAHAHWWDFIAPSFMDDYFVIAPNLSGMGDSGHRDFYSSDVYVHEIKALCDHLHFARKPLLIGHSLGGRLVFKAEQTFPDSFHGIIMADSPFNPVGRKFDFEKRRKSGVKPHRVYPTLEEMVERFRLMPEQPCANQYIVDFIARESIHKVTDGFQWKFDPKTYSQLDFEPLLTIQPTPNDKVLGLIYGKDSILYSPEILSFNLETIKAMNFPPLEAIENAYHHLFLDQPLAFIDAIKSMLKRIQY